MQKIVVLIGPTGIGKTDLALNLAPKINAEIISGDSMQIYREVSIGTAKPTDEELEKVKHYLVNQRSIFDEYSVKDFVAEGTKAVDKIVANKAVPLVVGGTGFYINALVNKLQLGEPGEYQTSVDSEWEEYLKENGKDKLWRLLYEKDPAAAEKIAPQNSRRTLRALTVVGRTGKLFSEQQQEIMPRYDALIIGLNSKREEVYQRINRRVDKMMDLGLLKEAEFVYKNRAREHQAIQAIGYKEFFPYFSGEKNLEECVDKLKQASRKYAKRQLTYFKHQLPVVWLDPLQDEKASEKALEEINNFLDE